MKYLCRVLPAIVLLMGLTSTVSAEQTSNICRRLYSD
jgi:hypothetical protein